MSQRYFRDRISHEPQQPEVREKYFVEESEYKIKNNYDYTFLYFTYIFFWEEIGDTRFKYKTRVPKGNLPELIRIHNIEKKLRKQ